MRTSLTAGSHVRPSGPQGGGARFLGGSAVDIGAGVSVRGNRARRGGGGLFASGASASQPMALTLQGVEISENTVLTVCENARAVHGWAPRALPVSSQTRTRRSSHPIAISSQGHGGGLLLDSLAAVNVSGCSLALNAASGGAGGGAALYNVSRAVLQSVAVTGNAASAPAAGALAAPRVDTCSEESYAELAALDEAAGAGGGLFFLAPPDNPSSAWLLSPLATLEGNSASASGAGAAAVGPVSLSASGVSVTGNVAGEAGGGFFVGAGASLLLADCEVSANQAVNGGTADPSGGGGVYVAPNGTATLRSVSLVGNFGWRGGAIAVAGPAASATLRGAQLQRNSARLGGAFLLASSAQLLVSDSAVANSSASLGGIFGFAAGAATAANITLLHVSGSGNEADAGSFAASADGPQGPFRAPACAACTLLPLPVAPAPGGGGGGTLATSSATAVVSATPSVRSGGSVRVEVRVVDGFGSPVAGLSAVASLQCLWKRPPPPPPPDATVVPPAAAAPCDVLTTLRGSASDLFTNGSARIEVQALGAPGTVLTLSASVAVAPWESLRGAGSAAVASVPFNVTIEPCGPGEAWDPPSELCRRPDTVVAPGGLDTRRVYAIAIPSSVGGILLIAAATTGAVFWARQYEDSKWKRRLAAEKAILKCAARFPLRAAVLIGLD